MGGGGQGEHCFFPRNLFLKPVPKSGERARDFKNLTVTNFGFRVNFEKTSVAFQNAIPKRNYLYSSYLFRDNTQKNSLKELSAIF